MLFLPDSGHGASLVSGRLLILSCSTKQRSCEKETFIGPKVFINLNFPSCCDVIGLPSVLCDDIVVGQMPRWKDTAAPASPDFFSVCVTASLRTRVASKQFAQVFPECLVAPLGRLLSVSRANLLFCSGF